MKPIYEFTDTQINELHQLYQDQWWAKSRTLEETKSCIEGSQLCIGLLDDDGTLIGFTRVLTDYIFKAMVFDVIVSDHARGVGLGSRLISLVESHPKLSSVKHFELYCLPDMFPFYHKHGFTEKLGDIKIMRKVRSS